SYEEFKDLLQQYQVDLSKFGKGNTKPLQKFFESVVIEEKCFLQLRGNSLQRFVELVRVHLRFRNNEGRLQELRIKTEMTDAGTERERNQLLAMVMRLKDQGSWKQALERCFEQKFSISAGAQASLLYVAKDAYKYEEYSAESETVPDMTTTYKTHSVVVTIKDKTRKELASMGLPAGEDFSTDDGKTRWTWAPVENNKEDELMQLLSQHGIDLSEFTWQSFVELYSEVYEKSLSTIQVVDGQLVRKVKVVKVWLEANLLSQKHVLIIKTKQQQGRVQHLRNLRTLSMRMRAMQHWSDAVSEALFLRLGVPEQQQKDMLSVTRSETREEVEFSVTFPGLKTVYTIMEVRCEVLNPQDQRWQYIGLPSAEDFTFCRQEQLATGEYDMILTRMAFEFSVFGVLACLCLAASAGQWSVGVVLVSLIVVLLGIRAYVGVPPTMKGNKLPKYAGKRFELIAMPVNHFGEKVRFCLDLLGLPYDETTNCGILNIMLFGQSVPQLNDRKSCSHIGNSDEILRYLHGLYAASNKAADALLKQSDMTLEWELALNDLGHAIQGWAYYYLLGQEFSTETALVCWGAYDERCPLVQRCLLKAFAFPIKAFMRSALKLDRSDLRDERKATIDDVLKRVDAAVGPDGKGYIVGDQLTYVDITFVSLLAPLLVSRLLFKDPCAWARGRFRSFAEAGKRGAPKSAPPVLQVFEEETAKRPCGKFVARIYDEYRDVRHKRGDIACSSTCLVQARPATYFNSTWLQNKLFLGRARWGWTNAAEIEYESRKDLRRPSHYDEQPKHEALAMQLDKSKKQVVPPEPLPVSGKDELLIMRVMDGKVTDWTRARRAAEQIRSPSYTTKDFYSDLVAAFPELRLYCVVREAAPHGEGRVLLPSISTLTTSASRTGEDEYQRTIGALFCIFWLMRTHLDGKESFCFGLDAEWKPRNRSHFQEPELEVEYKKRKNFYEKTDWAAIETLFVGAGLLKKAGGPHDVERTLAMLVLMTVHDVMKLDILRPMVGVGEFAGYKNGEPIGDHDVALSYVLERCPQALPSFAGLSTEMQESIKFTHCKLDYNMGWLVQAEAPPGALFKAFRKVVLAGAASDQKSASNIAFYFVHWFADLAGAEASPLQGCEKFVLKFPQQVLGSFIDSFAVVWNLGPKTETEVFEEYLVWRWGNMEQRLGPAPTGSGAIAKMRLVLMAQGDNQEVLRQFSRLKKADQQVLSQELAITGCLNQKFKRDSYKDAGGPAILVYYAPALMQKAGKQDPAGALIVMAEIFRQARSLWPLSKNQEDCDKTILVRIDVLKEMQVSAILEPRPDINYVLCRVSSQDAQVKIVSNLDMKEIDKATQRLLRFGKSDEAEPGGCSPFRSRSQRTSARLSFLARG
ncbi:CDC123, partial [Symbiodinium necroappetens]